MTRLLIKNAGAIISCDEDDRLYRNSDILTSGAAIEAIGEGLSADNAEVIDARGCFVYPGLINTHHHMQQAFTRNIPAVQNAELFEWLMYLYKIWARMDPDFVYYSALVAMSEFIKFGGTTMFDQHFAFPNTTVKELIDRQFDAADQLGLRFHAGRSSFTRGESLGGLPPDVMIESHDEILTDCERLVKKYHDAGEFSMRQVAIAPCSPFSVDTGIMAESARLARSLNVRLHTHLCETLDEERYCLEVYGDRPLKWAEKCGFTGPDVWYAHGIHFTDDEVAFLAETQTGVSHNAVSNMKLSSGICKVPLMLKLGVPVGLAVDGSGSNDASNMLFELRTAFLLHRLNSSNEAPSAYEMLKLATAGGAKILGRTDVGALAAGKAADMFLINVDRLEYVGALLDPKSLLCTVGWGNYVDTTIINGRVVFDGKHLTGVDEEAIKQEATAKVANIHPGMGTGL